MNGWSPTPAAARTAAREACEWAQIVTDAHRLGLSDEQITEVVQEWKRTPHDRSVLWSMMTDRANRVSN